MRLPKRGFRSPNRVEYVTFNVQDLGAIIEKYGLKEISPTVLYENRVIKKNDLVKILGQGEIKNKIKVSAHKFSAAAKEKIESIGGSIVIL